MIEAEDLSKKFDEFVAVDHINLKVKMGEILILLGPNGAGKTTTVRMLTSILRPTTGWAKVAGFDVVHSADQVRSNVGVLTEHHGLYGRMNADEYLSFFGGVYGLSAGETRIRAKNLMDRFQLEVGKKRLSEFSKGMRQKLALIRALLHEPPVVLLDEPTSAMDPESAFTVREAIKEMRSSERTIVLCTHNLKEAEELADQIAIIKTGKIILNGSLEEVRRRLIGPQEYVLRAAGTLDGFVPNFRGDAQLIEKGTDFIRFSTNNPSEFNPFLIKELVESNIKIINIQEISHSLEDIYLRIINQEKVENVA